MLQDKEFQREQNDAIYDKQEALKTTGGSISYKVLDDGKSDPKTDKKEAPAPIVEIFPFSQGQAQWVLSLMNEYLNLKKCVDIVQFFNAGGDNTYARPNDAKYHDKAHKEKVAFDEIQDLAIKKMTDEEYEKVDGKTDWLISIDGEEKTFQLSEKMSLG